MKNAIKKYLSTALLLIFTFQATGCGTILYPERRNQKTGRVDVGVALLDGFWLLVGIIPGVIAFAVDFSTGAIYIPEKSSTTSAGSSGYRVVQYDPQGMTKEGVEKLISQEIGQTFRFSDERYQMTRIEDKNKIEQYLADKKVN